MDIPPQKRKSILHKTPNKITFKTQPYYLSAYLLFTWVRSVTVSFISHNESCKQTVPCVNNDNFRDMMLSFFFL